jgi:hypothetical protein
VYVNETDYCLCSDELLLSLLVPELGVMTRTTVSTFRSQSRDDLTFFCVVVPLNHSTHKPPIDVDELRQQAHVMTLFLGAKHAVPLGALWTRAGTTTLEHLGGSLARGGGRRVLTRATPSTIVTSNNAPLLVWQLVALPPLLDVAAASLVRCYSGLDARTDAHPSNTTAFAPAIGWYFIHFSLSSC